MGIFNCYLRWFICISFIHFPDQNKLSEPRVLRYVEPSKCIQSRTRGFRGERPTPRFSGQCVPNCTRSHVLVWFWQMHRDVCLKARGGVGGRRNGCHPPCYHYQLRNRSAQIHLPNCAMWLPLGIRGVNRSIDKIEVIRKISSTKIESDTNKQMICIDIINNAFLNVLKFNLIYINNNYNVIFSLQWLSYY